MHCSADQLFNDAVSKREHDVLINRLLDKPDAVLVVVTSRPFDTKRLKHCGKTAGT